MLALVAEIVEEQGLQHNCGFCKRRVNDAEDFHLLHMHQVFSAPLIHAKGLHANVVLIMILLDVPMQTRLGVMDEVPSLIEPVEIDVAKAPPLFIPLRSQAWGIHRHSPDRTTHGLEVHVPRSALPCVSRILGIRGVRSLHLRSSPRVPCSLQCTRWCTRRRQRNLRELRSRVLAVVLRESLSQRKACDLQVRWLKK